MVKRGIWNGVISFAVLMVLLMSTSSARADYTYTFSGTVFVSVNNISTNTFSFTEPSLITGTGAFAFTPFTIDGTSYVSGFFNASNDCFTFSSTTALNCAINPTAASFFSILPGATDVGTFRFISSTCAAPACELVKSVTISGTATPEPSSLVLLGTGLLGFAGAVRRRWLS